jgi:hypothetical protein
MPPAQFGADLDKAISGKVISCILQPKSGNVKQFHWFA